MTKKTVFTIFGTRPEAIKMAPVVKTLQQDKSINCKVVVTAQHRQMLDQVLTLFDIKPDYDLDVMQANQDLFDVTSKVMLGLRDILKRDTPDLVLVHGDTTTCMAAALSAFYLNIPVGHVEAGLRTGDLQAPFPEEANRSIVGRIAQLHFSPTDLSKQNLIDENVDQGKIFITGNTVIDALLSVRDKAIGESEGQVLQTLSNTMVQKIKNNEGKIILVTGHRRENFGKGFLDFCEALKQIAEDDINHLIIYPVHLNPNVQKPVYELLSNVKNILLVEPADYLPFVWLLNACDMVITDSGGIQEEAPSLGKPVLVTREVTERPEAIEAGTVRLVGTSVEKIVSNTLEILNDKKVYKLMSEAHNPYGDGKASSRILSSIKQYFAID
jgi:UDP-N-acetylglucosamine 2-epimerase (non-hydrolysing)